MISSMTGYGRISQAAPSGTITVELRSTNHRYLEVEQRLPEGCAAFESEAAQLVRSRIRRGRIDLWVTIQGARIREKRVELDAELARAYYHTLEQLRMRLRLNDPVTLSHLLHFPNIVSAKDAKAQAEVLWPSIRRTLQAALTKLVTTRRREGARLVKDIRTHATVIGDRVRAVRAYLPKSAAQQQQQLYERLKAVLGANMMVTSSQIRQALAVVKDADLHEELMRLGSHLVHLREALGSRQAVGKTIDFIAQELTREANTMGAKAEDPVIAREVITIKGAIEKIREQAQNLE